METLQRIYGISFPDPKMLKEWEKFQEEAKNRDHRKLGRVSAEKEKRMCHFKTVPKDFFVLQSRFFTACWYLSVQFMKLWLDCTVAMGIPLQKNMKYKDKRQLWKVWELYSWCIYRIKAAFSVKDPLSYKKKKMYMSKTEVIKVISRSQSECCMNIVLICSESLLSYNLTSS